MAIRLSTIFKIPSHNRFNYQPRYYDPDKERFNEARRNISFRRHSFDKNPNISGHIARQKATDRPGLKLVFRLIRLAIIILIVVIAYLLATRINLLLKLLD